MKLAGALASFVLLLCGAAVTESAHKALLPISQTTHSDVKSFQVPEVIHYDTSVAEMAKALKQSCQSMQTRRIQPPFLDHVRREQDQIDCEGFQFENGSRHVEFVFRDDQLVLVWIMADASEDSLLARRMTEAYGTPRRRGNKYLDYKDARVALRLDRHEVLLYSKSISTEIESWFKEADKRQ